MRGRVLIIAGSDSGGGAGIQADIKAVTALGGFAMTAITALTAQNTLGVHGIHPVPLPFVAQQILVVAQDLGADAIKTGMLATSDIIETVLRTLDVANLRCPLVVDPVMVAKGGAPLLEDTAIATVRQRLIPRAALVTPNIPEAEALTGLPIQGPLDMLTAGRAILSLGAQAVLMKGGHGAGAEVEDWLMTADGSQTRFTSPRIDTRHTHGTGCTLASAIACGLAQGLSATDATARARAYVWEAIRTAPGYGQGHGPLNHAHPAEKSD
jgi:hydroxymethylpyrimidine/phosphomethylpyrimidine kinase